MVDLETFEFRRMILFSTAGHLLALALIFLSTTVAPSRRYIEEGNKGPMNIMWARPVKGSVESPPNKLPGPIVPPAPDLSKGKEAARIVLPEEHLKLKPEERAKPESEDEIARRKAMAEALAKLGPESEARPTPRPDNFPSIRRGDGGDPGGGGPSGVSGILGGDPAFTGYKEKIRQLINNQFLWIQSEKGLKAEVFFQIDVQGNIANTQLQKSSGNPAFDRAALRAVAKSSPLPPPPPELAADIVREQFIINFVPEMK